MSQISSNKQLKLFYQKRIRDISREELRDPVCKHFSECGGCALQHLNYDTQLQIKKDALHQILAQVPLPAPVALIGDPHHEYNYRFRMDYVTNFHPHYAPHTRLGLRKRGNFNHVIPLEECHLIPEHWFQKLRHVFDTAQSLNLPAYDLKTSAGFLRYLVIRQVSDAQAMLCIVTKTQEYLTEIDTLAAKAIDAGFTSVYWLHREQIGDDSQGDVIKYWGDQYLTVSLAVPGASPERQVELNVGPYNFFQNNISLFSTLAGWVAPHIPAQSTLLDLYCGVGTLGIALAHKSQQVVGVDNVAANCELAAINAAHNNVTASYHTIEWEGDVRSIVAGLDNSELTAIVDPPRVGLMPHGVANLLALHPQTIVYISCNPITQATDVQQMLEGYHITAQAGFDMFPQTLHLENVIVLQRNV